jgi:8-oxo-dGTP diphosphatase
MSASLTHPTLIAIAVVEHDGSFLIGQRPPGVALAGLWEFPGGKIEPGETPEAAAVRECLEETGIAVQPLFRYPEREHDYAHDRVQLIFVACRPASGLPDTPREPFRWVEREALGKHEFPAGNAELLSLLAASPKSL